MKKAILATKVGMTQIFNADGVLVPVTVLEAGPCSVTQIKTVENDGYSAVQVAFADKKEKVVSKDANGKKEIRNRHGVNKAQMGHFAKAGVSGKDIKEGVVVIDRTDFNYFEVATEITNQILALADMEDEKRKNMIKDNCFALAQKAEWTRFISYYKDAFSVALTHAKARNS